MRSAINCQLLSFQLETQLGKHLLPCAHGSAFTALGSITAFVYESWKGEREEERRRGWGEPATKTETYTMWGNCGIPPSPRIIILLKKQITGPAFHQVEGILLWWLSSF